ncbi:MAG: paraquat-inducible protein A [Campylobacterota bacterium]|nr:paraquat-inducible protein A [Campylobacterota bacterium]
MTWKSDISEGKTLCHLCGYLQDAQAAECTQCGAKISQRIQYSLMLTWGYAIAATLFLIPANLLPMMVVTSLGSDEGSTIIEGVVYFLEHGEYGLGAVIFIASVAVPVFKLVVIFYLLLIVQFKQQSRALNGTKLFHFIHIIGKWSMLDIFVVALMVSMVQFQALATIQTGGAAIAFAAAVLFTIIATEKFDPRLMWDTNREDNQ